MLSLHPKHLLQSVYRFFKSNILRQPPKASTKANTKDSADISQKTHDFFHQPHLSIHPSVIKCRFIGNIWIIQCEFTELPANKDIIIQSLTDYLCDFEPVKIVFSTHHNAPQNTPKTSQEKPKETAFKIGGHGKNQKIELPNVKKIIAVASGKGGVGKSTTSANLAVALSGLGLKIGLLDADIYGPSIPKMFGLSGNPEIKDGKIQPLIQHNIKIMSIGLVTKDDEPVIWRGPMVMGAMQQMFRDVEWGELDILLVDMPPGTGDAHLTLAQSIPVSGAIIVTTPQNIALIDAVKAIKMFEKTGVPLLGLIENMSYFLCNECDTPHYIFGQDGGERTAHQMGIDCLGKIPLLTALQEASDSTSPFMISEPSNRITQIYRDIALQIQNKLGV